MYIDGKSTTIPASTQAKDFWMSKLKIQQPPFPNREKYPFVASVRYRGMVIDIENLDGSVREGKGPNGRTWRTKFNGCHYGELRNSLGTDGDKLDVYIKSKPMDGGANTAYIVHQNFPRNHPTKGGQYDEDKVILGVSSAKEAKELYLRHYNRKDFLRSITEMPIEAFKHYAKGENKGEKVAAGAKEIGKQIGINWAKAKFPVKQLSKGIEVEHEHGNERGPGVDVGGDSDRVAARIAWAHLKELPDYYTRLGKMEEGAKKMAHKEYYDFGFKLAKQLTSGLTSKAPPKKSKEMSGPEYQNFVRKGQGKIPPMKSKLDVSKFTA